MKRVLRQWQVRPDGSRPRSLQTLVAIGLLVVVASVGSGAAAAQVAAG